MTDNPTVDDGIATLKVGDLDTTPNFPGPYCGSLAKAAHAPDHPGYYCTRSPGHVANHAAGGGVHIMAVWDEGDEFADDDAGDAERALEMVLDGLGYWASSLFSRENGAR